MPQHPAINAYEKTVAGIADTFDGFTAQTIAEFAPDDGSTYARAFFELLATWVDALDELDSELRGHVVAGSLPEDQQLYLKLQALNLFDATATLQRAVCEHYCGTAGPALSPDYGHAYALSNSALRPF